MTFNRLSLLAVATLFSFNVWAYGSNYDAAQFEQSIAQKKTILIHVHAPWCSTCHAQDMILDELVKTRAYSDVIIMQVNYDDQKDLLKKFQTKYQSTLILFKDGKEVDRITAKRNVSAIKALLDKSI